MRTESKALPVTQTGPVFSLSDNVLAEIFLFTKPRGIFATDGTRDIWDVNSLASVCQRWLSVAKATRACWARVEVTDERAECGWGMVHRVNKELEAYLRRSREARLCIKLNVARGVPGYASKKCPTLLGTLLKHIGRWGSLTVDLGDHRDIMDTQLSLVVPCLADMPLLRSIRLKNTGRAACPWLTILKRLGEGVPGDKDLRRLELKVLVLHSAGKHRDRLEFGDVGAGLHFLVNLTQLHAHVAPNVAVKMVQLCTSLVDAQFDFTMPRRTRVVGWSGGLVTHPRLVRLGIKTSPYPRLCQRRSFPHDAFAVVLDNLACPSLSSMTLKADAVCGVRPMGRDLPVDETAHVSRVECEMSFRRHLDGPFDPPSDQEGESVGNSLPVHFFPISLERFLVNSPSLRNLVLDSIPLHSSQLIRLFAVTPKLADLTIFEWKLRQGEDVNIRPELLSNNIFLDWIACEDSLPNLRHLHLMLSHSFEAEGPIAELIKTLECQGLESAVVKSTLEDTER
ncbi:hypothetical protein AAF712_015248 [Marasmius tenuissimus]|uniref:F-box domain-containing protein n=1 Tax=Marasmius tenuissimus TaxID=585030 RepID=A0ABR2Z9V3_9AGAR